MREKARDLTFILSLVSIILIGVYLTYKQFQSGEAGRYLLTLGEKVLAMVPESSQQDELEKLYQSFLQKYEAREIKPEQVEKIAANVINLKNSDTVVTPEQFKAALTIEVESRERRSLSSANELSILPEAPPLVSQVEMPSMPLENPPKPEEWEALKTRISAIMEFEREIQNEKLTGKSGQSVFNFRLNNELKVIMDEEKLKKLEQIHKKRLEKSLKNLEQLELLIWDQETEDPGIKFELEELNEQMNIQIEGLDSLKALEREVQKMIEN